MANVVLSEAEKVYILHSVKEDFRCDGRSQRDYRPMEIETGMATNAAGSARLRLANTDILVGVKTEIDTPDPVMPNCGKIEFFIDCSANAAPEFEGRGGSELADELIQSLATLYQTSAAFDLEALILIKGQQCWKLYVDVLILECGGNLYDAISLAVKAALFNTKIPKVSAELLDAGEVDLVLSDDPHECTRLIIQSVPLFVTVCQIGDACVVDPSAEEEVCSSASVVLGISVRDNKEHILSCNTIGTGSLHKTTVDKSIQLAISAAKKLDEELIKALKTEEQRVGSKRSKIIGFLG